MDDGRRAFRAGVLASCGAKADTLEELLTYNAKPFPPETAETHPVFPLEDEAHIEAWREYEREGHETDPFGALKRHFVQLRFPIRRGISEEDAYRQATRRGLLEAADAY